MSSLVDDDPENLPALKVDWEVDESFQIELEAEATKRRQAFRDDVRRKYPFLNDNQVELVASLDDAIDNSIPQVHLPRLKIDHLKNELSKQDIWKLLMLPTITFVLTASFAATIVLLESATLGRIFPFLVTLIAFCASVPSIFVQYDQYFEKIATGVEAAKKRVDPALDQLEQKATNLVVVARQKLNQFLKNMKKESKALQSKAIVVLPHVADLDGYLDNSEQSVCGAIRDARQQVNLNQFVPWALQEKSHYHLGVVLPILLVMLVLQLFGTWRTGEILEPRGSTKWEPVIASTQTFVTAVAQIMFSFFVTRKKRIVGYINRKIRRMNENVDNFLHRKAGEAFHTILDLAMNLVRRQVLEIVTELRRVERVLKGTRDKAYESEMVGGQATETVLALEDSLYNSANIETHHVSTWMQSLTDFFHMVAVKVDEITTGLIDCTGFVDTDNAKAPATKRT